MSRSLCQRRETMEEWTTKLQIVNLRNPLRFPFNAIIWRQTNWYRRFTAAAFSCLHRCRCSLLLSSLLIDDAAPCHHPTRRNISFNFNFHFRPSRFRCWQKFAAHPILRQHVQWKLYYDHRCRLQNPNGPHKRRAGETSDMGRELKANFALLTNRNIKHSLSSFRLLARSDSVLSPIRITAAHMASSSFMMWRMASLSPMSSDGFKR